MYKSLYIKRKIDLKISNLIFMYIERMSRRYQVNPVYNEYAADKEGQILCINIMKTSTGNSTEFILRDADKPPKILLKPYLFGNVLMDLLKEGGELNVLMAIFFTTDLKT